LTGVSASQSSDNDVKQMKNLKTYGQIRISHRKSSISSSGVTLEIWF